MDSCKQRMSLCVEATRERVKTWKAKAAAPDPYPGLISEQQYYEQLGLYMELANTAAFMDHQRRATPKLPRNCLPPDQMAARTPQLSIVRQARLYQQGNPYQRGPDLRPLLASVVYLPADKGAATVPVYSPEQVESAHLMRPSRGIVGHAAQVALYSGPHEAEAIDGSKPEASSKVQPDPQTQPSSGEQRDSDHQERAATSSKGQLAARIADRSSKADDAAEEQEERFSVPENPRASSEAKDAGPGSSSSRLPGSVATGLQGVRMVPN